MKTIFKISYLITHFGWSKRDLLTAKLCLELLYIFLQITKNICWRFGLQNGVRSTERAPLTIHATLTEPYILHTNPNKNVPDYQWLHYFQQPNNNIDRFKLFSKMEICCPFKKKRSRKDTKFKTHNIYGIPYPPDIINQTDFNEYNPTREETLRKKKANPPPLILSSHFLFLFPPTKQRYETSQCRKRKNHIKNRGNPIP